MSLSVTVNMIIRCVKKTTANFSKKIHSLILSQGQALVASEQLYMRVKPLSRDIENNPNFFPSNRREKYRYNR